MHRRKKKINRYSIVDKSRALWVTISQLELSHKVYWVTEKWSRVKEKPGISRIRTEKTTKSVLETIHGPGPAWVGFGQVGLIWRVGHASGNPRDRLESVKWIESSPILAELSQWLGTTRERVWSYREGTRQELSRVKGSKYQQRTRVQDNGTKNKAQTYWSNMVDDWGRLQSGRSTWVLQASSFLHLSQQGLTHWQTRACSLGRAKPAGKGNQMASSLCAPLVFLICFWVNTPQLQLLK